MRKSAISLNNNEDSDGSKSGDETAPFKYLEKLENVGDSDEDSIRKRNIEKLPSARRRASLSDDEQPEFSPKNPQINEYDPKVFENLNVEEEVRELFQYIVKYMPQQLTLDYKFKPFIPDYLPAVGDIDAFIKVEPPETCISGETFAFNDAHLGFAILDEPATTQSDRALLHLQLRASNMGAVQNAPDIIVKKVEKLDENVKVINKWIKDISDLHKSKSSPIVNYSEAMPDIDDLMQEWPEEMENRLKEHGFPTPDPDMSLTEYTELVCDIFHIPTAKNKIHSLHLLFSLYESVRQSKFFQGANVQSEQMSNEPDQLVLD